MGNVYFIFRKSQKCNGIIVTVLHIDCTNLCIHKMFDVMNTGGGVSLRC